ncbi:MAG TPA: hypothetical protein VII53_05485 [Solirubrobacteraceae bacterium]
MLAVALGAPAAGAAAAAELSPMSTHMPTFFTPGDLHDYYTLSVRNAGSSTTDGTPVTVTDTLPAGVTAAEMAGEGWTCPSASEFEGGAAPTCSRTDVLGSRASYPLIRLKVRVNTQAPRGEATNTAAAVGGGSPVAVTSDATTITSSPPAGVSGFVTQSASTQAGAHADVSTTLWFNSYQDPFRNTSLEPQYQAGYFLPAGGGPADLAFRLPSGLVGDPASIPECSRSAFLLTHTANSSGPEEGCPADTQVGFGTFYVNAILLNVTGIGATGLGYHALRGAVYNLEPYSTEPARLGVALYTPSGFVLAQIGVTASSAEGYAVKATSEDITTDFSAYNTSLDGFTLTLWGDPAQEGHDALRAPCLFDEERGLSQASCPSDQRPGVAFMQNPTDCTSAPITTLHADFYAALGEYLPYESQAVGPEGETIAAGTGCETVPFEPSLQIQPDNTKASAPAGLNVDLKVPQSTEPDGIASSELKRAVVTLPAGLSISPSAAAQPLAACTDAQFAAGSDAPAQCPADSVIGTTEVITPLLSGPLTGKVYLGQPLEQTDPTSGQMYRVFQEILGFGVDVKLTGQVAADPLTGQLTATFDGLPELPFSEFKLTLRGGPNALLSNPAGCGIYISTSNLTPYSGNPSATPSSPFTTSFDGNGTSCPSPQPFSPEASLWGTSAQAGADSQLSVAFARPDGQSYLSSIVAHLPPGLLGDIASVPLCPAANISAGSCPSSSRIGSVSATAGPGSDPLQLPGTVYLGQGFGPYPFALSVVVPAVAGPYNLGNVVVRVGIQVNSDGSISVQSDRLPTILDGIPIQLRGVTVTLDRPGFTFNPTNCAPQSLTATLTSVSGALASPSTPFQVGGCGYLPFKPRLTASTQANTSKTNGASLDVKVTQAPGESNIHRVALQLPTILPSRLATLQKACIEAQFDANPASCPVGSVIGSATASTPILNSPLQGPAYLVSHGGGAFPDVVFVLQGQGVTIDLVGNTDIKKGITYSRFQAVPDAPISSFEASFPEGPHSVLGANLPASAKHSLCRQTLWMPTTIEGQNGSKLTQTTRITVSGCAVARLKPRTRAQKLAMALKACKSRYTKATAKRAICEKLARERYDATHRAKRTNRRSK